MSERAAPMRQSPGAGAGLGAGPGFALFFDQALAGEIIARHAGMPGATLPILHALQAAFGYVPRETVPMIAAALNLSRAEIHGVVTFYHDFRAAPAGRHHVKLCRAEACQAMGGDALAARLAARLGVAMGETAADGSVTLEPVYCLGLCAVSPSAIVDGRLVGRLDAARIDAIAAEVQSKGRAEGKAEEGA